MPLAIEKQVRRWVRRVVRRVHPPAYILGRVACLGQDVFHQMPAPIRPRHHALLNMQKVRCDVINEWAAAGTRRTAIRTRAASVLRHLARKDVSWLIEQQERMIWFEHQQPVTCAVMDSFAELTDQRFRHRREGWSFACHYTDLNHTPEFDAEFTCEGLLSLEQIAPVYDCFVQWFADRHPGVPLNFIDFSAALDTRTTLQQRAAVIRGSLVHLSKRHPHLQVLSLPDEQIERAQGDDFAYHFSPQTVQRFAALWQSRLPRATNGGQYGTY